MLPKMCESCVKRIGHSAITIFGGGIHHRILMELKLGGK